MEELLFSLFPHLKDQGVKDFDSLSSTEKETYLKMMNIYESGQITLEEFKKHIHVMRQSVEAEIVRMLPTDPKMPLFQARLQNYLLFEAFFDRPERAKQMLEMYRKRV